MKDSDRKRIGIITDETADLPIDFIAKHKIEVVKYPVWFPGEDVEIEDTKVLYQRMRETKKTPKTSTPPPSRFKNAYKKALKSFEKILAIFVFKGWSSTISTARRVLNQMSRKVQERIEIFDSHLGSVGEGLIVRKAQELINQGKKIPEILKTLTELAKNVRLFGFLEDLSWVARSGRIQEPWASAALALQKVGIRPVLGLVGGVVKMTGLKITGKDMIPPMLNELKRVSQKNPIKLAVAHADIPDESLVRLKRGIEGIAAELLFISQLAPVVGAHTGPGTILVSYHY
jgi:DegV family protein with EDD domain